MPFKLKLKVSEGAAESGSLDHVGIVPEDLSEGTAAAPAASSSSSSSGPSVPSALPSSGKTVLEAQAELASAQREMQRLESERDSIIERTTQLLQQTDNTQQAGGPTMQQEGDAPQFQQHQQHAPASTNLALVPYCTCRQPDDGTPMVGCSSCDEWFHARCVSLELGLTALEISSQAAFDDALQRKVGDYVCADCVAKEQAKLEEAKLAQAKQMQELQQKIIMQQLAAAQAQRLAAAQAQQLAAAQASLKVSVPVAANPFDTKVYCVCRGPDTGETMVCCESCEEWFHISCVHVSPEMAARPDYEYTCADCYTALHGDPSQTKRKPAAKPRRRTAPNKSARGSGNESNHSSLQGVDLSVLDADVGGLVDSRTGKSSAEEYSEEVTVAAEIPLETMLATHASRFCLTGVARRVEGRLLTAETLEQDGFRVPVFIPGPSNASQNATQQNSIPGAKFPVASRGFNVDRVVALVGGDRSFDVVDVRTQGESMLSKTQRWNLRQWGEYYSQPETGPLRKKFGKLNVLSLEVSDAARLLELLESPGVVREMDWFANLWPHSAGAQHGLPPPQTHAQPSNGDFSGSADSARPEYARAHTHLHVDHVTESPAVRASVPGMKLLSNLVANPPKSRYYCLMGVQGSYTDWHVDFGGTSVWYHVVKGMKVFLLLPPTPANLSAYKGWSSSASQKKDWLGDAQGLDTKVYIETMSAGDTMLIPSGWIHAVYTPCDSLVFGGNFLHSLAMGMQARIHTIEAETAVPAKFRCPRFNETNWLAVSAYIRRLKEHSPRRRRPLNRWEADGLHDLLTHMQENIDEFSADLPPSLVDVTLDPSHPRGASAAATLLQVLQDLLDSATDIESRVFSKHGSGPRQDATLEGQHPPRSTPWEQEVERNRVLGNEFSLDRYALQVQMAVATNQKLALENSIKKEKQEVLRAEKLQQQQQQSEGSAAVAPDHEVLYRAAAAFEDGADLESDSDSSSSSSSFHDEAPPVRPTITLKRPLPSSVEISSVTPAATPPSPKKPKVSNARSNANVRARLAKKLSQRRR